MRASALAIVLAAAGPVTGQPPAAAPTRVVTLAKAMLKGKPTELAWRPDGTVLYVQATDADSWGKVKSTTRFVVSLANRSVQPIGGEPEWAKSYWNWKSDRRSPAAATQIEVRTEEKRNSSTAAVTAGDPRSTTSVAADTALGSQTSGVLSLVWKKVLIGEWTNQAPVPGSNFSWAPAPRVALVFAPLDGKPVTIVDADGRKITIAGSKSATLPAWSPDGTKLAWLQRDNRKQLSLWIENAPAM